MKNILQLLASIFVFFAVFASSAFAQSGNYNGNPQSSLTIDKKIALPSQNKGGATSTTYVENIGTDVYNFSFGESIFFEFIITNTSKVDARDVYIEERAPWGLEVISLQNSTFDASSNTLKISVGDLNAGATKTYIIETRVRSDGANLPNDLISCHTNYAFVATTYAHDDDTSSFCIKRPTLSPTSVPDIYKKIVVTPAPMPNPPTKIPATGPEMLIPSVLGALGMFALGNKMRKME